MTGPRRKENLIITAMLTFLFLTFLKNTYLLLKQKLNLMSDIKIYGGISKRNSEIEFIKKITNYLLEVTFAL